MAKECKLSGRWPGYKELLDWAHTRRELAKGESQYELFSYWSGYEEALHTVGFNLFPKEMDEWYRENILPSVLGGEK